jgi:hypothetical protein
VNTVKINSKGKDSYKVQIITIRVLFVIVKLMAKDSKEQISFNIKVNLKMVKNQVVVF